MIPFTVEPLPDPPKARAFGRRSTELPWAVCQGGKVIAAFVDEKKADSYARRLNQWQKQHA